MRRPDLGAAAVGAAAAGCALAAVRIPEVDAWWQIAYGRYILTRHALPRADAYSWTAAGHPLVITEWLFDALMAAAAAAGGWGAFALALACLLALGAAASGLFARRARSRPLGALLALLLLGLLLPMESLLPELASYALFAAATWILEQARLRGPRPLALLPPLFALWANVHGSFALGFVPLVLDTVLSRTPPPPGRLEARYRRGTRRWLPAALAASLAATLANPYGWRLLPYDLRLASSPFHLANIAEFQSPNFHNPYLGWFVLPALAAAIGAAAASRRGLPARDLLAAGGLLAGALVMVRMLPYALLALGLVAASAARVRRRPARPASWPLLAAVAAALLAAAWRAPPGRWPSLSGEPVAAAAYVAAHESGRGFNTYEWGGYLLWVWNGAIPVYIDSRGDMYAGTGVLQRYVSIVDLTVDPSRELEGEGVAWALLPAQMPLAVVLRGEGWAAAFTGGGAVVLVPPA